MTIDAKMIGYVSRNLPQADPDTEEETIRLGRYNDVYTLGLVRKQHVLADEGTYFTANNAQTGLATSAVAAFTAASPLIVLSNTDSPSNAAAKRIYLDYVTLITTAAGSFASAGVNLQMSIYLDQGDRYSSGGTDLSNLIVSPNMDGPTRNSIAKVRFGAIVATAATGAARCVVGLRTLRPAVSATVADVVGETKTINFGGVEAAMNGSITVANANMICLPAPPLVIGPNQCCLIYFTMNGTTPAAASYAPEISWWER